MICYAPPIKLQSNRFFFFFNDTATTEIYTLSLHDALPIYHSGIVETKCLVKITSQKILLNHRWYSFLAVDRKSTRLNSSHANISYAVFCLKKKKITQQLLTVARPRPPYHTCYRPCTDLRLT